MEQIKLVTIIGARPQFIKAATVSREIAKHNDIEEVIIHTGQHFDTNMSAVFFDQMKIPQPDFNLGISSLSHGAMTARMLHSIENIIMTEKPDRVLVYGDTNSTLAGALAAAKLHIKTAHVEAGLRSFNMRMPEEINRILTDKISDLLLCPTVTAVSNLSAEGITSSGNIKVTNCGDVMYDAALFYNDLALKPEFDVPEDFVLATIHRAENTDDPEKLKALVTALNEISKKIPLILPVHPRTRKILAANNYEIAFNLIDPVGYLQMIHLLKNCSLVMTDSGGLQKEAYFFKKPCLTLRTETEWIELVDNGYNVLCGSDAEKILSAQSKMINSELDFSTNLYGDGKAAEKVVQHIKELT